jgi:hypothetical protein
MFRRAGNVPAKYGLIVHKLAEFGSMGKGRGSIRTKGARLGLCLKQPDLGEKHGFDNFSVIANRWSVQCIPLFLRGALLVRACGWRGALPGTHAGAFPTWTNRSREHWAATQCGWRFQPEIGAEGSGDYPLLNLIGADPGF